jgi:TolC family type I secretion outer membrane protein
MALTRAALFLVAACLAGATGSHALGAETLTDALVQTYNHNPTLLSERASLRATDESVPQARSGWRPTVSLNGSVGVARRDSSITSREQDLVPRSYGLEVSQPLYRGGRTVSSTDEAEATVQALRARLLSVEQSVLLSAVTAYIDVLRDAARVQLTRNNEMVLQRQLEATNDRFEVGEVTRTDVAQSQARLSGASAARVAAEGDLAQSRATYQQIIGASPGTLEAAPPLPDLPQSQEDAMSLSLEQNPDVLNARYSEQAAQHAVRTAVGQLLPTVDLVGALDRSDETTARNVDTSNASVSAQVRVPLYQSGAVHSRVREAKERRSQARIDVEVAERQVVERATQAWEILVSSRSQISAREEEVKANQIALEGVRQEAEVGSRTTLDVLDAEQELLDAQVALVVAERNEYVAGFELLAAVGGLTAQKLELPVEFYDPAEHLDQVRNKWWGLSIDGE